MSTLYEDTFEYRTLFRTYKKYPSLPLSHSMLDLKLLTENMKIRQFLFNITLNVILLQMKNIWLYFFDGGKKIIIDIFFLEIIKIDIFISTFILCMTFLYLKMSNGLFNRSNILNFK